MKRVAVIPGDGVGPEVIGASLQCLEALFKKHGRFLETEELPISGERYLKEGVALSSQDLEKLSTFDAILFGAIGHPKVPPGILEKGILLKLRFYFDLYANLRPIQLFTEELSPLKSCSPKSLDCLVVRENTEGIYVGCGGNFKEGTEEEVATQEAIYTYRGVSRILDLAFQLAKKRKKRLCMSDKSNVLTFGHGLWQRVFAEKKKLHPEVTAHHMYIDALAMALVRDPSPFDVIVTCNLFGDILTDLGAQLQGGMGIAASANIHPGKMGMFEPVHGSAPDIAGKGIANPFAALLSLAMLLKHLNFSKPADEVEGAVRRALRESVTTKDLGGSATTEEVALFVRDSILQKAEAL